MAAVELHLSAAQLELGLRLGERHLAAGDLVLERLREAVQQIDRRLHLARAIFEHAGLAEIG
ncbi:hypothetical protein ABIE86_004844 [Bradyrhizobium diazoefficiens]